MKLSLGYITTPTKTEAKDIALELLESGLVACCNIISGVESYFVWEEEIAKANETVIIFKTRTRNENKIVVSRKGKDGNCHENSVQVT